uniref:SCP domain-containing protein n=1 Tax=Strongyloides stercoralis TaxID=6248 RepID=A0A0K0E5L5_STRER
MISFIKFIILFLSSLVYVTPEITIVGYYIQLLGALPSYEYKNVSYPNMKKMIKSIVLETRVKNLENLLIYPEGFKKKNQVMKNYDRTCESVLPYLSEKYKKKYYEFINEGKPWSTSKIQCGNKRFSTFDYAVDWMHRSNCDIKAPSSSLIPQPNIGPAVPPKKACIMLPSGQKFLKANDFSYKMWFVIWAHCDFYCYYKKNFASTKLKYFFEINAYRFSLNAMALTFKRQLNKLAQERALELARGQQSRFDFEKFYKEIVGYSHDSYAKFFVKILYDDAFRSNNKRDSYKSKEMSLLMNSNVRRIGIGIANRGSKVFIVLLFC